MIEESKTFKRLAQLGGFFPKVVMKSHRGLIAKLSLPKLEKYELAKFEESMPRVKFSNIAIKQYGQVVSYV